LRLEMGINVEHNRPSETLTERAVFADLNCHSVALSILVVSANRGFAKLYRNSHAGISFSLKTTTATIRNISETPTNKSTEPHGTVPLLKTSAGL
jgi:hypothetical protein